MNSMLKYLICWLLIQAPFSFASGAEETSGKAANTSSEAVAKTPVKSGADRILLERPERAPEPLMPGKDDPSIARFTAHLLEANHYSRKPFDDETSEAFLERYLNMLDPQHIHLLQSDIDEFEKYRDALDELTLKEGDTRPAYEIMLRFRERLSQRVAFVKEKLKTEPLVFEGDERVTLNRHELPYPKKLDEARQLWHQRLRFELLEEKLNKEKPEEIVNIITRRYNRMLRAVNEMDSGDTLQTYLTALSHVYDPHSDYLGKAQLENFAISMNLSLFGIGAVLTSEDGYCKIKELVPEGPAEKSKKIKVGDRIVAVAQGPDEPVDIVDMKLSKAVELIRGPKDTEVRLTLIPSDATDSSVRKTISIIRKKINLEDQQAKADLIEIPRVDGGNIRLGVIDLPSFYSTFAVRGQEDSGNRSTTADVKLLLEKLKKENASGVILDLRRNGGGSLEEAINLTGLFIKEGPVVQVQDTYGFITVDSDEDPSITYDGPLIVLTSRFSASASEILAGALQDYGRAVVVGDASTHGKGTVQAVYQLGSYMKRSGFDFSDEPGALKLTIRKFYRASGESTQLRGVTPDIVLPSVNNEADVGEDSLENPLPWDTVSSADGIEKLHLVRPYLGELREHVRKRIAASQEFAWIYEDIAEYREHKEDKTVSLNEQERLEEKEEAEARKKAHENERLSRKHPDEKVYEITLNLATKPGLPEPLKPEVKEDDSATASGPATGETEQDDEESVPQVDVTLNEAKRILVDYIGLFTKQAIANVATEESANL